MKMVTMQAGGLLLTRRRQRAYAERGGVLLPQVEILVAQNCLLL